MEGVIRWRRHPGTQLPAEKNRVRVIPFPGSEGFFPNHTGLQSSVGLRHEGSQMPKGTDWSPPPVTERELVTPVWFTKQHSALLHLERNPVKI